MLCIGMFKCLCTGRTFINSTNCMNYFCLQCIYFYYNHPHHKHYAYKHTHTFQCSNAVPSTTNLNGVRKYRLLIAALFTRLVDALSYKPEGRGFDSQLYHWDCSFKYPSARTIVIMFTQLLTEKLRGWFRKWPVIKADKLTKFMCQCRYIYIYIYIYGPQPPGTLRFCPGL
jgi:hypothetical protein